jgi:ABC-type transport system involved in multi-copper enzyme maturation permease subunit
VRDRPPLRPLAALGSSGRRIWAIGLNTFREAMRNRVLAVLVLFAVGLMAFSLVLGELSLHEEVRVIKDIGLGGISLSGIMIALFLGVNLLSKELDRKTVYFVIPKPLFRWEFLLGKFFGLGVTLALLTAAMAVVLAGFVMAEGGHHGVAMVRAEVLVLLELLLVTAIAMLFSSFSSPYLSAMFTAALWIIGRNTVELRTFADGKLADTPVGTLLGLIAKVVPDFHLFYISGANLAGEGIVSVHEDFVSWTYVAQSAAYCIAYGATCLLIAVVLFSRRDFT